MTRPLVVAVAVTLMLAASGCSSDDGADATSTSTTEGAEKGTSTTVAPTSTTSTTQPRGDDPTVEEALDDLAAEYARRTDAVTLDPEKLLDKGSAERQAYLELWVPGSTWGEEILDINRNLVTNEGKYLEPVPGHDRATEAWVVEVLPGGGANEVQYVFCERLRGIQVDKNGKKQKDIDAVGAFRLSARRVEGRWTIDERFEELDPAVCDGGPS